MRRIIYTIICLLMTVALNDAVAQVDKSDVRKGNRKYKKENWKEAEIEYRKGIVKDSLSVAANYNLAASLYRQNNFQEAQKVMDRLQNVISMSDHAAEYFYNLGDIAIANQDWQTAVSAFEESLLRNPGDLQAKENYIYAKKKLQQQQQQQDKQDQQDQNNQDKQDQQDQNQDQQDEDQDKQDQNDQQENKDQQQDQQNNQDGSQPKITPQAAQQMLQAIQAKEKETQEKVKKEKAKALQAREKDKNW